MTVLDDTKSRLLESAGAEFAEKGYDNATVRSICARAGANLAAVNYHFGDKEQLYLQTVLEAHRCGVELPPDEVFFTGSPADQLRRFIYHFLSRILALHQRTGWRQNLMLREMLRPTKASETLVRDFIRPKFDRLLRVLRQIAPAVDERRLHALAFSVIGQCLHYKMARPIVEQLIGPGAFGQLDVDYLTDHITAFSLAALGLAPPFGQARNGCAARAAEEAPCAGSH